MPTRRQGPPIYALSVPLLSKTVARVPGGVPQSGPLALPQRASLEICGRLFCSNASN